MLQGFPCVGSLRTSPTSLCCQVRFDLSQQFAVPTELCLPAQDPQQVSLERLTPLTCLLSEGIPDVLGDISDRDCCHHAVMVQAK